MSFKDKKVLVTGSSDGIGASIAEKLSNSGYGVFITGRNQEKLLKQANSYNVEGWLAGDLLNEDFPQKLINTAVAKMGKIDILVNNAGIYVWSPLEETSQVDVKNVFKLNLEVPYRLSLLVTSEMKERKWGRIINIGSISGTVGEANASLYSASKAGMIGMTKSLALELAEYGISINVVNPGWVKTGIAETYFDNESLCSTEQLDMIPQKRWIEPYEIATLVNYLVSPEASGITGQSVNLCCGLSLG